MNNGAILRTLLDEVQMKQPYLQSVRGELVEPHAPNNPPFDKLVKQLAIRLNCPNTTAKSLVIRANG